MIVCTVCEENGGQAGMPVLRNEKARRALPFATGFPLVAYLRYYRGDRADSLFCFWKPARALPFACGLPTYRSPRGLPILVAQNVNFALKIFKESSELERLCLFSFPTAAVSTGVVSTAAILIRLCSDFAFAVSNSLTYPFQLPSTRAAAAKPPCNEAGEYYFSNDRANRVLLAVEPNSRLISRVDQ